MIMKPHLPAAGWDDTDNTDEKNYKHGKLII